MFEQINRLHTVSCELSHAHSLLGFTADYFCKDEPDTNMLAVRYRMYGIMAPENWTRKIQKSFV